MPWLHDGTRFLYSPRWAPPLVFPCEPIKFNEMHYLMAFQQSRQNNSQLLPITTDTVTMVVMSSDVDLFPCNLSLQGGALCVFD